MNLPRVSHHSPIPAVIRSSLVIACIAFGLVAGPHCHTTLAASPGKPGNKAGGKPKPGGGGGNNGNKVKKDKKPRGQGGNKSKPTKERSPATPKEEKRPTDDRQQEKDEKPDKEAKPQGGKQSRSKLVKINPREIGSLATMAIAWIQGDSGNATTSIAPFFGTTSLKSGRSDGGKGDARQNSNSGLDTLAVLQAGQREKLRTILDQQRPLIREFRTKQTEFTTMLDGLRNDEPAGLSQAMSIARELGKIEGNVGLMQAELLAQMQLSLDGPELQRMQNIRSAHVNNYPASVTAEEREAAQGYLSSLPRDDQRELTELASKALAWLTVARQPVDPEAGEKKGAKSGGKGSKTAGYLVLKSGGGGGNKEDADYDILSQLTTSQVRILTSATVSQARYRAAYEERRGWLEQVLSPLKQARFTADRETFERVASDMGGYAGRIAFSQAVAFRSLSRTLTDEQRKTLLTGRQTAERK